MNRIAVLALLMMNVLANAQVNEQLQDLSNVVSIQKDTSDWNYPHLYRTCRYTFQIIEDTLHVNYINIDEGRTIHFSDTTSIFQKMFLGDIDTIDLNIHKNISIINDSSYIAYDSDIFFMAQKEYPLFKAKYKTNGRELKVSEAHIPIYKHSDTTSFKKIIKLIEEEVKKHFVEVPPNCEMTKIKIDKEKKEYLEVMGLDNIEIKPKLNQSDKVIESLDQLVSNFMLSNNIVLLDGYVIVNSSDELEFIDIMQERMKNRMTQDSTYQPLEFTSKVFGLNITTEQFAQFKEMLKNQVWTAGQCNGIKVSSIIEFSTVIKED